MEEKGLARKSTQGGGAEVEQVQQVFQLDVLFKKSGGVNFLRFIVLLA